MFGKVRERHIIVRIESAELFLTVCPPFVRIFQVSEDSFQNILESPLFQDDSSIFAPFSSSLRSSPLLFRTAGFESFYGNSASNNAPQSFSSAAAKAPIGTGRTAQLFKLSDPSDSLNNKRRGSNQGLCLSPLGGNNTKSLSSSSSSTSSSSSQSSLSAASPNAGGGTNANRYKTELCRPFQENGVCKYGDKCQFAHGRDELRSISRHPKYKTDLCRTYHSVGFCPYGPRCHFIHNLDEVKPAALDLSASASPAPASQAAPGMPPLPMFSSPEKDAAASSSLLLRLRCPSDSGYVSSSSVSSSNSQSPADYEADGIRLPIFSTISK